MKHAHILLPVLLSASLLLGQRAVAQPVESDTSRTEIVRYSDLDLAHPAGIAALDRRIDQAVTRVCSQNGARDLISRSQERHCRAEARATVDTQRSYALAQANGGPIELSSRR